MVDSNTPPEARTLPTVVLLPLLLIPLVITGFFAVYALVGIILEGDSFARWHSEAWSVALPTAMVQVFLAAFTTFLGRYFGLAWQHVLVWSGPANAFIVVLLAVLVFRLVAPV